MPVRRPPVRPDLDQLLRQAKELLRAINDGESSAIAELREQSEPSNMPSRRDVLKLALAAPVARLAGAGVRPETLIDAFQVPTTAIVAPLPTKIADLDVFADNDPQAVLAGLNVISRTEIAVTTAAEHAAALRLYRRTEAGEWRRIAANADGSWTLPPHQSGTTEVRVGVALPSASPDNAEPVWPREIAVDAGPKSGRAQRTSIRVAPFIIPSSLEPVDEIWIVSRPNTIETVRALEALASRAGLVLRVHEGQDPCDQWMQDTMEPGVYTFPVTNGSGQARAVVTGMRREFGRGAAGLDQQMADKLRARGEVAVVPGVPRPQSRWIDWFGNIEVTPPHADRTGKRFPYGRIITGRQRELTMHPSVMKFFEAQRIQWPPIVLDTSWLGIGHIDEVINFVPARTPLGYKVLLPSPKAAREMLDALIAKGLGEAMAFADTRDQAPLSALRETAVAEENTGIDTTIASIRDELKTAMNIADADFVMVPALFRRGRALIPNAVNCLVANGHVVTSEPRGPRQDGTDVFETAIRAALAPCDVHVTFVDAWRGYHMASGEVHCGTNTMRRLRDAAWWTHE